MPVAIPVGSMVCRPYGSIRDARRAATDDSSFGAGRKPCREAISPAGVAQLIVAKALGLPQPYVSDVARARYRTITVENARKFARVLWLLARGSVSAGRLLSSKQRLLSCSRLKSWPRRAVARPRPCRSGRSIRWTPTWHPCLCSGRGRRSRARCRDRRRTSGPSGSTRSGERRRCCTGGPGR